MEPDVTSGPHPLALLLRGFCVDWISAGRPEAAEQFLRHDYIAHVGAMSFSGLDSYIPAVLGQLNAFPGLALTVHDVALGADGIAMVFSEHGSAITGEQASWRGVGLFTWDGSHLTENWTEEDYYARRRQLSSGVSDPVPPPAVAPWATPQEVSNEAALNAVTSWLSEGTLETTAGVVLDDGLEVSALLDQRGCVINQCFSAGSRVAFQATLTGTFLGGLGVDPAAIGQVADLGVSGLVSLNSDGSITGQVVRDRLGLRRSVLSAAGN